MSDHGDIIWIAGIWKSSQDGSLAAYAGQLLQGRRRRGMRSVIDRSKSPCWAGLVPCHRYVRAVALQSIIRRVFLSRLSAVSLSWLLTVTLAAPAFALTPNSAEVQSMIQRGLDRLASRKLHDKLGGKCLVALVFVKAGQSDHPSVKAAVEACRALTAEGIEKTSKYREVYSLGLAITFLCELDPLVHRRTLDALLAGLYKRQDDGRTWKQNGAFGYVKRRSGDTSMTQYAVLAMWTAHRSGIEVPGERAKEVCEWLLRTQDPSGAWGYQGNDPGPNSNLVKQREIRSSMVAAGLGSTYMLSDLMGLNRMLGRVGTELPGIPAALRPVPLVGAKPVKGVTSSGLATQVKRAVTSGDEWLENNFESWPKTYPFYYLYALERYQSFRELAWGIEDKSPAWYVAGYDELAKNEEEKGAWRTSSSADETVNTSFALLFLMRGTRKSIQRSMGSGNGMLVGGRGVPTDVSSVQIRNGRLVDSSFSLPSTDLLDALEASELEDWDEYSGNPALVLISGDANEQSDQASRFRRLTREKDYRVRRLAMRALAVHRKMENVPYLIYGITDPDEEVSWTARQGLRSISRNLLGVSAERYPDSNEKKSIAKQWKEWYATIQPDTRFFD